MRQLIQVVSIIQVIFPEISTINTSLILAKVGACAITAIVHNNKLYVANAGDCGGVLCQKDGSSIKCVKTNQRFNAGTKKEKQRLRQQFKDDNIVVCKAVNFLFQI